MRQTKGLMVILTILIAVININAVAQSGDLTPPNSNMTFLSYFGNQIFPNNGWFNQNITLNITSTDEGSGISKIIYVIGGVPGTSTFSGAPTTTFTTYPNISNISVEGSTTVTYSAIDVAGNIEPNNRVIIKLDKTSPNILTIISPPPNGNGWLNVNAIVNFTADDSLSGVAEILGNTTVQTEGSEYTCGNATDIAGNINSTCVTIKIDKTAPVTSASLSGIAGNNGWNTSDVNVSLNAIDSISGVLGKFYNLNNTGWNEYSLPILISAEGSTSIQYNSSDNAGNNEASKEFTIYIDKTNPVITSLTLNNTSPNTGNDILVTVDATDNVAVTAVTANGASLTHQTGNIWNRTIYAIEGTHSVNVSASDSAGNVKWDNSTIYTAYNTLAGTNQTISFHSQKTNLTFDNLTSNGLTDVNVSITGYDIPSGFQLAGNYYNITTTATFEGNITVTLIYDPSKVMNENGLKLLHYENGTWKDVTTILDIDTDTISGTVSSLSLFVIVEPKPPASPCTTCGGGGGGGGGGGVSGENYYNIEIKEKYDLYIFKDKITSYRFKNSSNPIVNVNITGNVNAGEIGTSAEVLRKTSTLLNISASDIVYKNVNIWVGTSGFASSKNIKEAVIGFKVSNSWLVDNSIDAADIKMVKWDGSRWVNLETMKTMKDGANTYYEAKTITFSNFAITGIKASLSEAPLRIESAETMTPAPTAAQTGAPVKSEKAPAVNLIIIAGAILIVAIIIALYMKYKKT